MYAILIRTVFFYVLLTLLIRLMGKRQIGELQLTEFVAAMLLSELAALPMTDRDIPVSHGVTALATTVCLEVVISFVSRRCPRFRKLLDGDPVFLIYKGKILEKSLSRTRISLDEIFAQIRNAGVRDIADVEYIILEQTGKMSVLQWANKSAVSPADMELKKPETGMTHTVVIDGKINTVFLSKSNHARADIERIIKTAGVRIEDILFMTMDESGKSNLFLRESASAPEGSKKTTDPGGKK